MVYFFPDSLLTFHLLCFILSFVFVYPLLLHSEIWWGKHWNWMRKKWYSEREGKERYDGPKKNNNKKCGAKNSKVVGSNLRNKVHLLMFNISLFFTWFTSLEFIFVSLFVFMRFAFYLPREKQIKFYKR